MADAGMRALTTAETRKFTEFQRRRNMALAMFRPMAHQEPFFRQYAKEFLLRGGNRSPCIRSSVMSSGGLYVPVKDLLEGDTLEGFDGNELVSSRVKEIHRFEDDGWEVITKHHHAIFNADHPLWCDGRWVRVRHLMPGARVAVVSDYGSIYFDEVTLCGPTGNREEFVGISTETETYIADGFVCHNSGKSTCAASKFASIACDIPITLADGTVLDQRQPWQKGRCLTMWIIGYDLQHIGQTIYRLLFRAGLFRIIKDEVTGLYRAYKPWMEQDSIRESEAKDSPPLIPARFVDPGSWVWENKKGKEFKKVNIRDPSTGRELAEIYCYSSKADPKAGDPVDVIWIDESIENPGHYSEWKARLVDRRGNLFWSSWPNANNDALQTLTERAINEENNPEPGVREHVITLSDNKSLSEQARREALGMFTTEEEKLARDKGEYVTDLVRMYPLFNEAIHQALLPDSPDKLSQVLQATDGVPPHTWTHELILDPGTQSPGVLFCAIPPPELGEYFVIYDEISIKSDAEQLAELIRKKFGGREFNRFIIDAKAAAQHGMGYQITVAENYTKAFAKRGIKCRLTGSSFSMGCTDVGGRIMALQEWMHIGRSGFPKLRIVKAACPQLCQQLRKYKKASVNNDVRDDRPAPGQRIDLGVCCEYFAASFPVYVPPESTSDPSDPDYEDTSWYAKFFGRRNRDSAKKVYRIGPKY